MSTSALPFTFDDPHLLRTDAYIGGAWRGSDARFAVVNPADGATLTTVANCSEADTELAIKAAEQAFAGWRAQTGKERAAVLKRWHASILQHADDLAQLLTAEQGKPLAEAKAEVIYGASFVEWFAEQAKRVMGETLASTGRDKRMMTWKEPIGVTAAITPWNFPIAMLTRKVAPALAAGCTIVIKPAEQTPLSALALAELAHRAGLPPGVLNVVTADGPRSVEIGKTICASPTVRKLSFTGSTEVGRILMAQCAPTVKRLSLELGGHAPFIVFDDADLEQAVEGAMASKYRNAGQTCVCTNRFYVQDGIYDAFVERLSAATAQLKVGSGFQKGVQIGPLIDEAAVLKVERHVNDALSKGARTTIGGQRHALGPNFFEPTVLAEARDDMLIAAEETFGPVSAVFRFKDEAQAVTLSNASEFGLAAYFYSQNIARVYRVAEALEYGIVGVNTGLTSNEVAPFGGVKQSGMGREGSVHGIEEYLTVKYVCLGGL